MSATPAGTLARIKCLYPLWMIVWTADELVAQRGDETIRALDEADLEQQLNERQPSMWPGGQPAPRRW
jgi:hypothetical protein